MLQVLEVGRRLHIDTSSRQIFKQSRAQPGYNTQITYTFPSLFVPHCRQKSAKHTQPETLELLVGASIVMQSKDPETKSFDFLRWINRSNQISASMQVLLRLDLLTPRFGGNFLTNQGKSFNIDHVLNIFTVRQLSKAY